MVNTGGSSGSPFSLFIQPNSMGHEWAHTHHLENLISNHLILKLSLEADLI